MFATVLTDRIHQGDVFKGLQFKYITEDGETQGSIFPFWIIITQECDLEHDFKSVNKKYKDQDKSLQTILSCPAFLLDQLKNGTHMQNLALSMPQWGGDNWKKILSNRDARFHTISTKEIPELPDLIVDFKRFFTFPRDYIYSQHGSQVARIDTPYKESLSQRFAFYTSRVALPEEIEEK